MLSPLVWLVYGSLPQPPRRLRPGLGLDPFVARGRTSRRGGSGLHAGGNQTLFTSAAGRVERGASGGQFLVASGQQQLRQQQPKLFPGSLGELAAPPSSESGAGRFGLLPRSLVHAVGNAQTQICGGGALKPASARFDQKRNLLAGDRNP